MSTPPVKVPTSRPNSSGDPQMTTTHPSNQLFLLGAVLIKKIIIFYQKLKFEARIS
jgi:hypothetical protein